MSIRSHVFHSSGEAYDTSQTSDAIRDGDVLLVPSEKRVAVLVEAWPINVGDGDPGPAFHALNPGVNFQTFRDGQYLNAAIVATSLLTIEGMKAAGLSTLGSDAVNLNRLAKSHGWVGEIPEQERFRPADS
jgi:hypothetical protein